MSKLYTVIEKETAKELFAKMDKKIVPNCIVVEELRTEAMDNPHFDFETRTFYNKEND